MPERLCMVEGCVRSHYAKGLCKMHYSRQHPRTRRERPKCKYEGCVNPRNGTTWCTAHERHIKSGKPPGPLAVRRWIVDGTKECADCGEVLPVEMFYAHHLKGRSPNAISPRCKECHLIMNRWRLYGLTRQEVIDMLARPCDACGTLEASVTRRHIDHDHDSNVVRGVLCHQCNIALGLVREDINVLKGLIAYIEKHRVSVAG